MKKIWACVALATWCVAASVAHSQESAAPTRSDVVFLKDKIAKLESQVESLKNKLTETREADSKLISELRRENRSLKLRIKGLMRARQARAAEIAETEYGSESRERFALARARAEAKLGVDANSSADDTAARSEAAVRSVREASAETVRTAAEVKSAGAKAVPAKEAAVEPIRQEDNPKSEKSGSVWDNMFPF